MSCNDSFAGYVLFEIMMRVLNNKIEKICNNNKCTYINMYDNLTDKNGNMKRIYTVDGLHLNKIGYKAVASKLTKYLNE